MADIPSQKQYIQIESTIERRPASQDLFQSIGGSINYLIDLTDGLNFNVVEFNSNGTWTCPANTTKVLIFASGGGGGGCSFAGYNYPTLQTLAAFGGGGASLCQQYVDVTPSSVYSITIGNGGVPDFPGGDTVFSLGSPLVTAKGGLAGGVAYPPTGSITTPRNLSVYSQNGFKPGISGTANVPLPTAPGNLIPVYGGSAGPFGNGADVGLSAAANTGAGGGAATAPAYTAGFGGSGKLLIVYV